jgi:hypothetical protein
MATRYRSYKLLLADVDALSKEYLSDTLPPISYDSAAFALYKNYIKYVCSDGSITSPADDKDNYGLLYTLQSSDPNVVGSFAGALADMNDPELNSIWATDQVKKIQSIFTIFGFIYGGPGA